MRMSDWCTSKSIDLVAADNGYTFMSTRKLITTYATPDQAG